MRQISLKLKTYASNIDIINNSVEKFMLRIILWSFGVLALGYILILSTMVINIIERRSLEKEARTLSSEVGDLELTYLSMSNNIDLNFSHSLGFQETQIKFATRKSLGSLGSLKLAKNEI